MIHFFKNYIKTILIVLVIFAASLLNLEKATPDQIQFFPHFDKLVHMAMYATLTFVFLWENYCRHNYRLVPNRVVLILLLAMGMGVLIEVLQSTITEYRSGEFIDEIANIGGSIIGWFGFKITQKKSFFKKYLFKSRL